MTPEQINQLVSINVDKLAPELIDTIRERLQDADEGVAQAAFADLKSTTTMFLIAFFLGGYGVDRFMLGQTGLGIAKLCTCGGCGIWAIIDWFNIGSRTRQYNAEKILSRI